jgi:hypothetical protein
MHMFIQEYTQGLNATARRNEAYEDPSEYHYLQQPLWWAGILLCTFLNHVSFARDADFC